MLLSNIKGADAVEDWGIGGAEWKQHTITSLL